MSSSSNSGGVWEDGAYIVRRDKIHRWFPVIDSNGTEHRWLLRTNGVGAFAFAETHHGPRLSPILWGLPAVRNWLLVNGYTPKGSRSPEWARQMTQARATTTTTEAA